MRIAIIGAGRTMLGQCLAVALIEHTLIEYKEAAPWKLEIPNLIYTFGNLVEPTPCVGNYQSRNVRPVIWAAALRQFDKVTHIKHRA